MKKKVLSRFRIFKAILFILGVLGYGYCVSTAKLSFSTFLFAFIMALYLSEVYSKGGCK